MKQLARKAVRTALSFCAKKLGFDPYRVIKMGWERWVLRKALRGKRRRRNETGVNLFFPAYWLTSLSKVGRDFAFKLAQTDIPFSLVDTTMPWSHDPQIPDGPERRALQPFVRTTALYRKSILLGGEDLSAGGRRDVYKEIFFEFDEGFRAFHPKCFSHAKAACVFSDFCLDLVRRAAPPGFPVAKIRYPFPSPPPLLPDRRETRKRFGVPEDVFAVFFNFALYVCSGRKNQDGCMAAFTRAFKNSKDAWLVLKLPPNPVRERLDALRKKLADNGILERTVIIAERLEMNDVFALTAAMDVYLSLHRGEGLGLGMLEAMSLGVPVVATAYGGNMEFMNEGNSFLVPYERHVWTPECGFPRHYGAWAEPDIAVASNVLRFVRDNPEECQRRSKAGIEFVRDYYSVENFKKDVIGFLEG